MDRKEREMDLYDKVLHGLEVGLMVLRIGLVAGLLIGGAVASVLSYGVV